MLYILFLILISAIIILAYFLVRKNQEQKLSLKKARQAAQENKEKAKNNILKLFKKQDKIANADVENLLSVSDATATRYLQELEKEDKIVQHGEIGRGVFYTNKWLK